MCNTNINYLTYFGSLSKRADTILLRLGNLSGMSTVNWTVFMWYLIYNSLVFDSSMNRRLYGD